MQPLIAQSNGYRDIFILTVLVVGIPGFLASFWLRPRSGARRADRSFYQVIQVTTTVGLFPAYALATHWTAGAITWRSKRLIPGIF